MRAANCVLLLFLTVFLCGNPSAARHATIAQRQQAPTDSRAVDLSPSNWPEGELQQYARLDQQLGQEKALGTGAHGVVSGTTGASAVRAGLEALRQGGTAADAAITTSLAQIALAQGAWVSYAGIFTMVYYDAETGEVHNLNAGYNTVLGEDDPLTIPGLSTATGGTLNPSGRTALVPGYMRGVEAAHQRFGKLPFEQLFQPAIHFAEEGFELSPLNGGMLARRKDVLSRLPETARVFTKDDGEFYAQGDVFKQPELANTLRAVAEQGADYMYTGDWAKRFVELVNRDGGKLTAADLANYKATWSQPVRIEYGGHEIYAHGLPAQGGAHLAEALNVATAAGLRELGHYAESAEAFFWRSQIDNLMVLSFLPPETRAMLLGDDATSLADRATTRHSERVWDLMQSGELALTSAPENDDPKHSDAVVAIDQWGNIAAVVHTINTSTWGETGIFVDGVSIPDSAAFQQQLIAEVGPGKRLPDPTEPLIVFKNGKPVAAFSSIGSGLHQHTLSALWNLIDFDKGLGSSLAGPSTHFPKFVDGLKILPQITAGEFPQALIDEVREQGLDVQVVEKTDRAARGYVIGAVIDSATGDPSTNDPTTGARQAATSVFFNGQALGY